MWWVVFPPSRLYSCQGCIHDGNASSNPRPEPRGDPSSVQRRAADACYHGGFHPHAQEDLQVGLCRRPGKIRSLDGRVWVSVENGETQRDQSLDRKTLSFENDEEEGSVCHRAEWALVCEPGCTSGIKIIQRLKFTSEDWCLWERMMRTVISFTPALSHILPPDCQSSSCWPTEVTWARTG